MALTKSYHTVNGRIIGETSGGVRTDYITDALGSVTATVNQNAQIVNTYRYRPYGGQLSKSGSAADPEFRWVGDLGYRSTSKRFSDVYIRARHYGVSTGVFVQRTPHILFYWKEPPFVYADSNPVTLGDPTGLMPIIVPIPPPHLFICPRLGRPFSSNDIDRINRCIRQSVRPGVSCPQITDPIAPDNPDSISILDCLRWYCLSPGAFRIIYDDPDICCKPDSPPARSWRRRGEPCTIVICTEKIREEGSRDLGGDPTIPAFPFNFIHELLHCCGVEHGKDVETWEECNDVIACCIYNVVWGRDENKCKRRPPQGKGRL